MGLTPGSVHRVCEHGAIRFGFATCFDVYFPEHFATLAAQEADPVLCPSYQRSDSADRIRAMAQVRAYDSGAYVIRSSYAMEDPDVGGRSLPPSLCPSRIECRLPREHDPGFCRGHSRRRS